MTREQLTNIYFDWKNNFLSVSGFAEYYGLFNDEAEELINLSRKVAERNHPDA